jgi:5-methylcytosine-specific restriction protein A
MNGERRLSRSANEIGTDNRTIWSQIALCSHAHRLLRGLREVNLNAMRAVVDRHVSYRSALPPLSEQEATFDAAVRRAIADSAANRDARLLEAAKMPMKMRVVTEVYVRNPDVIAAVLARAAGLCERCAKAAPLVRKKDGTPYLEVHHRKQLAYGGENTVGNANALCANCPRALHYGVESPAST